MKSELTCKSETALQGPRLQTMRTRRGRRPAAGGGGGAPRVRDCGWGDSLRRRVDSRPSCDDGRTKALPSADGRRSSGGLPTGVAPCSLQVGADPATIVAAAATPPLVLVLEARLNSPDPSVSGPTPRATAAVPLCKEEPAHLHQRCLPQVGLQGGAAPAPGPMPSPVQQQAKVLIDLQKGAVVGPQKAVKNL